MCRIKGDRVDYCERAHSGQACEVKRSSRTYSHTRGSGSRDDTPSPVHPLTPNGSGTYFTQHRRPSNSGSRPSTRDGLRVTNDIIIVSGSKTGRSGKYQHVTFSTKGNKRSSLGSLGSNEAAIDSPGSDASYTIRTGFPEAPLPPPNAYDHPNTYLSTPSVSHGYHHRHTPSASSSQTPSLTVTSEADYDLPARRRGARPPAPIIHNPIVDPPSSTRPQVGTSSGSYRTSRVVPSGVSPGASPLDYDQYADYSGSSRASSGAAEPSRPAKSSGQRRKKPSEDRSYQEDLDRKVAQALEKEENDKQVRFELGRAQARADERAERALAEKEKERAAEREARHQRKAAERLENEKRELEEQKAKERKKDKSKPPTTDYSKRPTSSRKYSSSMTHEQQAEQRRLLEADRLAMESEKQAAEEREREEARAAARQQQEASSYYDPRGGNRTLSNANNPTIPRRGSLSRHDSVASTRPPLVRSSSKRRSSVSQPSPPIITQRAEYSARPTSSRKHAPPPVSFPKTFNPDYSLPQSARRTSFGQDSNPLSPSFSTSTGRGQWDMRTMESDLPSARPSGESRYYTTQSREPVISYPARPVRPPTDYVSTFDDDDDVSDYVDPPVYVSHPGLSRSGSRRKH